MSNQTRAEQLKQKRSEWRKHLECWRSSGLTQIAYCRQHDLKVHQFTYWKKRLAQTDVAVTFVPVNLPSGARMASVDRDTSLRIIVDGDLQIEIRSDFDPQLLRRLIATLRSRP